MSSPVSIPSPESDCYDVVIVGGGPAGLSAALALLRSLRKVLLVDSEEYRNGSADHMQNIITAEGMDPKAFHARARKDLLLYKTLTTQTGHVVDIQLLNQERNNNNDQKEPSTKITIDSTIPKEMRLAVDVQALNNGPKRVYAKRIVLATGVKDILPTIPGLAELWGITVHACPYCHGYEYKHTDWGILVPGGPDQPLPPNVLGVMDIKFILMFAPVLYSFKPSSLTIFTNGRSKEECGFSPEHIQMFSSHSVKINEAKIKQVTPLHSSWSSHPSGLTLQLEGQPSFNLGMLYLRPPFLHSTFVFSLQLKLKPPFSTIDVDMFGKTSNPYVYAAGDCTDWRAAITVAAGSGTMAGAGINHDLAGEEWGERGH